MLFHPLKDETARMFLEPSNYVAMSLLKVIQPKKLTKDQKMKLEKIY